MYKYTYLLTYCQCPRGDKKNKKTATNKEHERPPRMRANNSYMQFSLRDAKRQQSSTGSRRTIVGRMRVRCYSAHQRSPVAANRQTENRHGLRLCCSSRARPFARPVATSAAAAAEAIDIVALVRAVSSFPCRVDHCQVRVPAASATKVGTMCPN